MVARHRIKRVLVIGCAILVGIVAEPRSCQALPARCPLRVLCDAQSFTAFAHVPSTADCTVSNISMDSGNTTRTLPLPVLLYLHGMGQSGEDILKTVEPPATGSPPAELYHGRALKELADFFVMVAPQTNRGWQLQDIGKFLDFLFGVWQDTLEVHLDATRVYISGHSIGGTAALQAAAELRSLSGEPRFAAAIPVAPSFLRSYDGLGRIPVWLHHGANDIIAPVAASDHAFRTLRNLNSGEHMVRYSRYEKSPTAPGRNEQTHAGHASPIQAYSTPELYKWLLRHSASLSSDL